MKNKLVHKDKIYPEELNTISSGINIISPVERLF
jgi:hypothetical protein